MHRKELGKPFLFPEDRNIVAVASDTPPAFPDEQHRQVFAASLNLAASAIRDAEQTHLVSDSGSASAPDDVAEMLPFAWINDIEAVCDLVMRSAVPLQDTLRRLQNAED